MRKILVALCALPILLSAACGAEEAEAELGIPGSHYEAVMDSMVRGHGFDVHGQSDYYQYQKVTSSNMESGTPGVFVEYSLLFYEEDDTVAELLCTVSGPDADEEALVGAAVDYFAACAAAVDCDERYPEEAAGWIAETLPAQTEDTVIQAFGVLNHHLKRVENEDGELEELVLIIRHYQKIDRCNSID